MPNSKDFYTSFRKLIYFLVICLVTCSSSYTKQSRDPRKTVSTLSAPAIREHRLAILQQLCSCTTIKEPPLLALAAAAARLHKTDPRPKPNCNTDG